MIVTAFQQPLKYLLGIELCRDLFIRAEKYKRVENDMKQTIFSSSLRTVYFAAILLLDAAGTSRLID